MIFSIASAAILTRTLSGADYGTWTQYRVVSNLLVTGLSLNLGHGFLRFGPGASPERRKELFSSIIGLHILLVATALVVLLPFTDELGASVFGRAGAFLWIAAAGMALLTAIQGQMVNGLHIQSRSATAYSLVAAYRILSLLALSVLFVWASVEVVVWVSLLMLGLFVLVLAWRGRQSWSLPSFRFGPIRELLAFTLPLLPIQLAMWVVASSDRFFIQHHLGLEAVGRYALVYTFALLIPAIYGSVSGLFMTAIVRWYEGDERARVGDVIGLAMRAYIAVGTAMLVGLYLGARPIITWIARAEYAFDGVQEVALAVGAGGFFYGLLQLITRLYDLAKWSWAISGIWLVAMILNLILNNLWIPEFGLLGAAIATLVSYGFAIAIGWLFRPQEIALNASFPRLALYLIGLVSGVWAIRSSSFATGELGPVFALATLCGALALVWAQLSGLISVADIRAELARRRSASS
jgi:O-antigen/teichoic acid export membrane protein